MALHPVRPLGETDPPGIGVRLDVLEEHVELRGEFALHEDLGPAHPDDLGDMLDFDRADMRAGAAGRAGPDLAFGDGAGDEGLQLIGFAGDNLGVVLEEVPFEIEEDHLRRERFVAGEGRAGVLTPAAFHAGESVEGILPGEVCRLGQTESFRILEVHEREFPARNVPAEEDVQGPREHVEVFRVRHVGDEAEDQEDVQLPGGFEMGVESRRVQTSHEPSA